nr:MAG TPA: Protein of unknown function (DUF3789) [Caudoviricetes sp.]
MGVKRSDEMGYLLMFMFGGFMGVLLMCLVQVNKEK